MQIIKTLATFIIPLSVFFCTGCQQQTIPTPTIKYDRFQRPTSPDNNRNRPSYDNRTSAYPQWIPPPALDSFNRWEGILIHHSASDIGDAASIDDFHRNVRGWDSLGYHFVIDNGNNPHNISNGAVEVGVRWQQQKHGAHCRVDASDENYWNEHTIGICLVGNFESKPPTPSQYDSLARLVSFLQNRYHIPTDKIIGHRDAAGAKTKCPGKYFSWSNFRQLLNKSR